MTVKESKKMNKFWKWFWRVLAFLFLVWMLVLLYNAIQLNMEVKSW